MPDNTLTRRNFLASASAAAVSAAALPMAAVTNEQPNSLLRHDGDLGVRDDDVFVYFKMPIWGRFMRGKSYPSTDFVVGGGPPGSCCAWWDFRIKKNNVVCETKRVFGDRSPIALCAVLVHMKIIPCPPSPSPT